MGDQSRAGSAGKAGKKRRTRRVWLAAAVGAAMFSFVLLAPQLGSRVGQAQGGRGNLLRFCPGLGIPCVEITREAYDRDANQTPILVDGDYQGQPRKLLAMASRSGYYFLLDRATGESLVTVPYGPQNWSAGVDKRGQPIPKTEIDPAVDGTSSRTTTNWWATSFSPDTGLLRQRQPWIQHRVLMPNEETGNVEDHQGGGATSLWSEMLLALDYRTGKVRWSRTGPRTGSQRDPLHSGWPAVHQ